jgi:hypothetical protein
MIIVPNCEPCEPCANATYQLTLDGEPLEGGSGSITSGENANIPIDGFIPECEDARAVLKDTATPANVISTTFIASGTSADIIAPDGTVTVNRDGVFFADVDVRSNGTASINVPSDCPAPSLPQGGMLPFKTGQTPVYETGDDGTTQRGQAIFTLPFTNPYGNTTRYLDTLGGTTYANGITLDLATTQWATPTTGTFMGYVFVNVANNFTIQVANALAATHGGYSGWSIINDREMKFISYDNGVVSDSLNHSGLLAPDNIAIWTGKTNTGNTAQAAARTTGGIMGTGTKTATTLRRIDARLFNFSVVGGVVILS